jgi:hypothetical protein
MGKTHSKPLAARHGRGTAWARHAMCESALKHVLLEISVDPRKQAHQGDFSENFSLIVAGKRLRLSRGSVLAFGNQVRGFSPAVGFLGRNNPQHAFLPRGSKAVGPMS